MRLRKEMDKKEKKRKNKNKYLRLKKSYYIFFNLQSCDKFMNAPTLISSNAQKHFTDLMAD